MIDGIDTVILASASPRRRALLEMMGLAVTAMPAEIDESRRAGEAVVDYVRRMAIEKLARGRAAAGAAALPVIAGDTVVSQGETIHAKPRDRADATRMLRALSGRTHVVQTAVAVACAGRSDIAVVRSEVTFATLTERDIARYWDSGEPVGKAGAYAIQGLGGCFVKHLEGSYSAVVGLPVFETRQLLLAVAGDATMEALG